MPLSDFSESVRSRFEIKEWKHSIAILKNDFPEEWKDLVELLEEFELRRSWITTPGGRKSQIAEWIDQFMCDRGWVEKQFLTSVTVDDVQLKSPTHKIDCYKNRIALELEWNNKDPFFDRDLNKVLKVVADQDVRFWYLV
ncbi:hypothetical protein MASR2M78_25140 [Treponema sp.]